MFIQSFDHGSGDESCDHTTGFSVLFKGLSKKNRQTGQVGPFEGVLVRDPVVTACLFFLKGVEMDKADGGCVFLLTFVIAPWPARENLASIDGSVLTWLSSGWLFGDCSPVLHLPTFLPIPRILKFVNVRVRLTPDVGDHSCNGATLTLWVSIEVRILGLPLQQLQWTAEL